MPKAHGDLRPRPSILAIEPYVAGAHSLPGVNRVMKLSSNESALGPSPRAIEAARAAIGEAHRYPDGGAATLRAAIAARFGLDAERIVCGAGSDDLLCLLAQIFGGEGTEVVMTRHGFLMYEIFGQYAGSSIVHAAERERTTDVDALLAAVGPRTRLVMFANPNNPTGTMVPFEEVVRLHRGLPSDVVLVVDGAYAEFLDDAHYDQVARMVERHDNVVMTRTFSKIYGLGGMRLGWLYGSPAVIDLLARVRSPFNANLAAQAAGVAAMADREFAEAVKAHTIRWRDWLAARLRAAGIGLTDSHGNFLLADFGSPEAAAEADRTLKARGVIVRGVAAYKLPSCLRISIGTEEEVRLVADVLAPSHG